MANGNAQSVAERMASSDRKPFPIDMAVASYDRTRPLLDGRVKPEGIALNAVARYVGEFCVEPVYEQYDVAEMSFSWYVMARSRGEPVMALPVFPLRMPVFGYIFVREDSAFYEPKYLIGKRVGVPSYRFTVNLWLRGMFREHYGVTPEQLEWVTCTNDEGAGYEMPAGIRISVAENMTAEQLLTQGKVDAIFVPRLPAGYIDGNAEIRHLFRDAQAETHDYYRRTGILPITHTLAIKESLTVQEPWVSESLVNAFQESQRVCDLSCERDPKDFSLMDAPFYQAHNRRTYGTHSWVHGVEANRKTLETFLRYAHEQGYTERRLTVEELFPANTLSL
jgi:4,5-dihydroxyphthalate decarboxylase